jgi:hypothetical protein
VQRGRHADLVGQAGLYQEIYDLQLRDQEQFRREMLFLDREGSARGVRGAPSKDDGLLARAERPDVPTQQLRPSSLR